MTSSAAPAGAVLHRSIARVLREEIAQGRPAIGDLLSGEHELCARFGSSRHTIRAALRTLTEEGLIERRQGAATRVVADRPRGPYQPSMHSVAELRQYAAETMLRVDTVTIAAPSVAEAALIGGQATEPWLRVDGVRWAGPEVVCGNRVFIHARFRPLLPDLVPGATLALGINEMVASRSGVQVASVEQDIAARPLPSSIARPLGLKPGSTALLFVRRYRDSASQVLVWSLNWHPGERFIYRMRLQRDRTSQSEPD